jgi:peptidylprolyl isomerase
LPAVLSAIVVVAIFVVLGFVLARSGSGSTTQTGAAPTTGAFFATTPGAVEATPDLAQSAPTPAAGKGAPKTYSAAPPMTIDPQKTYMATLTTPRGDIEIKLRPDLAPQTVNSFVFLSREGFYNGLTWHRVIEGFMAQGGDPEGTGGGGPGYNIPAEFTDKVLFDRPGIVAMARRGDDINSAGSQFFITTAPAESLNNQYTVFGEVVKGQEIADGIPLRDPASATAPGEQIVKITITEQ